MKCIGAFSPSVSAQTGENIPGNVYTQSNLLAGNGIEIVDEPVEGGIDNHTLACWHFDDSTNYITGSGEVKESTIARGDASIDSSFHKFGAGSVKSSGGEGAKIRTIQLSLAQSFTYDFWLLKRGPSNYSEGIGFYNNYVRNVFSYLVYSNTPDTAAFYVEGKDTVNVDISEINSDSWYHVALVYDASSDKGVGKLFINGVLKATIIDITKNTDTFPYTLISPGIGCYIDELRISDIARPLTADGKFPVPTRPYSLAVPTGNKVINNAITKTSQLTNDSGFITDVPVATTTVAGKMKPDGNTITVTEDGTISAVTPSIDVPSDVYTQSNLLAGKGIEIINEPVEGGIDENTLACWHFDDSLEDAVSGINFNTNVDTDPTYTTSTDGFGNCLLNSRSTFGSFSSWLFSDKKFYNTSFTVDFKFILRSTGAIAVQTGHSGGLTFYIDSSSIISKYNSTNRETYSYSLSRDSWHHVAFVKNGNVINYYIDGVFVHSYTYAESDINSFDGKESSFGLKVYNSSDNGNIDELRISDIARPLNDDGTFPVPTKPYSLAVPTGNKVINNTLDVSSLVTKEEVSTGLSTKQDTITGSNGEVAYHNGTGVFTQSILNLGYACVSTAEVNQCKNNAPSFSAVFNTWKKFSHKNATNDAIPSEMTAWTYDSGTDTITQPLNTESYVGFISPKSYSSYDITVRCYSTGSDDDSIGLVAAFAKDSNGLEHTLSFIRSPGGTSAKWVAILDYNQFALTGTSYGQKILVNNSAASTTPASTANWNTESIGTGTVIKMVRSGNVITAKCSQFNSNTIDDNTLITVDLDALSTDNPTLNLFKGASPWGYSNFSQPSSKYENISVTDTDGMIFDIPNNQVLQYSNGTWVVVSGQTPISAIGAGRLSYNSVTGKLFFCTGTDIIQIGKNTDI